MMLLRDFYNRTFTTEPLSAMDRNGYSLALALGVHSLYHAQRSIQHAAEADMIIETEFLSGDEGLRHRLLWQKKHVALLVAHINQLAQAQAPLRGRGTLPTCAPLTAAETKSALDTFRNHLNSRRYECMLDIQAVREQDSEDIQAGHLQGAAKRHARKQTETQALTILEESQGKLVETMEQFLKLMHDQCWDENLEKTYCGRHN